MLLHSHTVVDPIFYTVRGYEKKSRILSYLVAMPIVITNNFTENEKKKGKAATVPTISCLLTAREQRHYHHTRRSAFCPSRNIS